MTVNKEHFYRYTNIPAKIKTKPYFLDFHKLTMDGDYQYPVHCHSNYEAIYVVNGPYCCNLNTCELEVASGNILIVKPGDWHKDHLVDKQFHYVLHFSIHASLIDTETKTDLFCKDISPHNQISSKSLHHTSFFENLEYELANTDSFSTYIQDALLEVFFWQILRLYPKSILSKHFNFLSEQEIFQTKIYKIFNNNLYKKLNIEKIAKEMAMSKRTLAYKCNELLGKSAAKAFSIFKLQKAENILLNTSKTIQEISELLGYDNQFHFSRSFKKQYKVSPKIYRKPDGL